MEATVGEEGDRANWRELARAPRGRVRGRLRPVQGLPRDRGALRRDAQDPHPALGRRQGLLHRLRRGRLHDEPRRERRDRHPHRALRVHLADDADDGVRLRHPDRRAPAHEAHAGARRLRLGQLPHRARLGDGARRREGAGVARLPRGIPPGRQRADAAVRLRLLRRHHGPGLLGGARVAARPRLRVRARARPRRAGDGPALVRGRQAAEQEEHVHRLHRRHALPRGGGLRGRQAASRRWAAAPAAC